MGKRVTFKMPVGGGMFKAGDAADIPNNCSEELKNVFVRPGPRYEKRDGWVNDGNIGAAATGLYTYVDATSGTVTLGHNGGFYRDSGGTWVAGPSVTSAGDVDFCHAGFTAVGGGASKLVLAGYSDPNRFLSYFNGTTATTPSHTVKPRCVESLGRRLFLANTQVSYTNLVGSLSGDGYKYETTTNVGGGVNTTSGNGVSPITITTNAAHGISDGQFVTISGVTGNTNANVTSAIATVTGATTFTVAGTGNGAYAGGGTVDSMFWGKSGSPTVTVVGPRRKVTLAGATDIIFSNSLSALASETTVSFVQWFLPIDATQSIPLRLQIRDAAGTTTYGSKIIEIPAAASTGSNDWIGFYVQAKVPSGATPRLYVLAGDGVRTVASSFYMGTEGTSPDTQSYGSHANTGTYLLGLERPMASFVVSQQPQRIRWSEVDNADDIRVDSWLDIKDSAGPITAMKALDRLRLAVYKERSVFTYALTDSVDLPIQREGSWYEVGCVGPKALTVFENVHYFIGPREVYRFDGSGAPEPLAGDAMREAMFNQNTVAYPVIEMDADNRELYVYVQSGKIHVYNLATKAWSYINIGADLTINDLIYCKANGETRREMWAAMAGSTNIVRLKQGQTQDNVTGVATDVTAEVWFKPIQSEDEVQQLTVENLTLRHEITASQASSTTAVAVSFDGGATFDYANTVRVNPLATGGTTYCEVPLWETAPRLTIKVTHTGLAGASCFNLTSATATIQLQGRASIAAPTAVSNTL